MSTSCWLRDSEGVIPCFEVVGGGENRLAVGKDCKPEGRVEDVVPDLDDPRRVRVSLHRQRRSGSRLNDTTSVNQIDSNPTGASLVVIHVPLDDAGLMAHCPS